MPGELWPTLCFVSRKTTYIQSETNIHPIQSQTAQQDVPVAEMVLAGASPLAHMLRRCKNKYELCIDSEHSNTITKISCLYYFRLRHVNVHDNIYELIVFQLFFIGVVTKYDSNSQYLILKVIYPFIDTSRAASHH